MNESPEKNVTDPVHLSRVQAELDAQHNASPTTQNIPQGMTQDQIANIAKGVPDPSTPQNPSQISTMKDMSIGELQQFCLSLKAELDVLTARFETLASENFKVTY